MIVSNSKLETFRRETANDRNIKELALVVGFTIACKLYLII